MGGEGIWIDATKSIGECDCVAAQTLQEMLKAARRHGLPITAYFAGFSLTLDDAGDEGRNPGEDDAAADARAR